jgi:hypothetical protein
MLTVADVGNTHSTVNREFGGSIPLGQPIYLRKVVNAYHFIDTNMQLGFSDQEDSDNVLYSASIESTVPQAGAAVPLQEEGITVEGAESSQQFTTVHVGALESQTHSIVIKIKGDIGQEQVPVTTAVVTRKRITCKTCGTRNESTNKYCKSCGTNLMA